MESDTTSADRSSDKGDQEFTPQIAFAMGAIKGTVENLRTDLKEWKEDLRLTIAAGDAAAVKKMDDLEARVRALEKWRWLVAGAAATGGLAGGKLIEFLAKVAQ